MDIFQVFLFNRMFQFDLISFLCVALVADRMTH